MALNLACGNRVAGVAAIILGNQDGVRVVVAVRSVLIVWTLFVLAFCSPFVRRACLGIATRALHSPRRLAGFVAALLLAPIALIAI